MLLEGEDETIYNRLLAQVTAAVDLSRACLRREFSGYVR
jgi:hypothetical protein